MQGLTIVNRGLKRYANQHSDSVTFLDCGAAFFDGPNRLSDELLPDALHPSAKGDCRMCLWNAHGCTYPGYDAADTLTSRRNHRGVVQ